MEVRDIEACHRLFQKESSNQLPKISYLNEILVQR